MDKSSKKRLKAAVRDHQRKAALAALPLSVDELDAMFEMLDGALSLQPCDHTRRLTKAWLVRRGHDVEVVFAWLDTQGGFCDCEVSTNVEQEVEEAKRALRAPAN